MNKHIKSLLACAAAALTLAGCEMNDFNENYLEGFDPDTTITDIKTLALELTDDDYSAIASNSTNKSLATTLGGDASSALAAIGTNKYFSSSEDAQRYIPAWIAANYSTADDGSSANVTYALANGMPENVAAMNAMKAYTLTTDDYKTVWGSETDYVEAITPATASKLASVISAEELEAGDYVAVTYKYSATEPTFGGTEDPGTDPDQPKEPEVTASMAGEYLFVAITDDGNFAAGIPAAGKYYLTGNEVTVTDGKITASAEVKAHAWKVADATDGNYTIQDANGLYYYMKGTYNSFNYQEELGDEGFTWTFTVNDDNSYTIKNVEKGKYMQFEASYGTYGCYDTEKGVCPTLYRLNADGSAYELYTEPEESETPQPSVDPFAGKYLFVAMTDAGNFAAGIPAAGKYYLTGNEVTVTDGKITANADVNAHAWTVAAATDGNYTFQDANGLYYYMKGTYNSFNYQEELGDEGFTWTFTVNDDNSYTIKNVEKGKYMQFEASYGTYGCYDTEKGVCPTLYRLNADGSAYELYASAAATYSVLTRAAAVTTVNQYGIYNFDGSKFTDAGNVIVQPADFTAMGNTYGSFTNPDQDTYLPKFLAANYPYAKEGDTKYVSFRCYNSGTTSWKTDEYVFDSSAWVKNDYIEATSDKFERTNKTWTWNPSVTLYFQPVRNEATAMAFFQAVTDWVWANIDQPMGITSKGAGFVTSYGNNEYYTGCSAYYNNVDLRAASARAQYSGESYQGNDLVAAGVAFSGDAYDSLSDNEVQELMIKRLQYVVGKTLEELYPDMRTIDGIEIFYTVHVPLYRGTTVNECNAYLKYKVTGPAQLEFVEMVEY